jgi:hypothetical protein
VVIVNTWQCLLVPFEFDDCLVALGDAQYCLEVLILLGIA